MINLKSLIIEAQVKKYHLIMQYQINFLDLFIMVRLLKKEK
jgi:hypothetical protein